MYAALVWAALGWAVESTDEHQVSATVEVSANVVAAQQFTAEVTTLDEELGAYRIAIAMRATGDEYCVDERSYLLLSDVAPQEAMLVSIVGGQASFTFTDDALAFDITNADDEAIAALLDLVRTDFGYASVGP